MKEHTKFAAWAINFINIMAVSVFVLTGIIAYQSPKEAIASPATTTGDPIYMAGKFNPSPFCHCPVLSGNCMCVISGPPVLE